MPNRGVYLLLVLLFCLAWASGFTAAKLAITTAPPALFGGIRFLITGLALLAYAAWRGQLRGSIPWKSLSLLGLLNQAGYQGLAWQGMDSVSAGLATIIASLNPILIAALAAPLLGERLHWRKVLGLLLGFAGAVFVVRHRLSSGSSSARCCRWWRARSRSNGWRRRSRCRSQSACKRRPPGFASWCSAWCSRIHAGSILARSSGW